MKPKVLVLACGALAHELVELQRRNGWTQVRFQCLPAALHNTPKLIPDRVREALVRYRQEYQKIFVAYADCGTAGALDEVLREFQVERLPGAHCYEFFAGAAAFARLAEEEPGTFYLTNFLARHFRRLVIEGLGLDRNPELRDEYFRNYRRLVFLDQGGDQALATQAQAHARFLGLEFEYRFTGLAPVEQVLAQEVGGWPG